MAYAEFWDLIGVLVSFLLWIGIREVRADIPCVLDRLVDASLDQSKDVPTPGDQLDYEMPKTYNADMEFHDCTTVREGLSARTFCFLFAHCAQLKANLRFFFGLSPGGPSSSVNGFAGEGASVL